MELPANRILIQSMKIIFLFFIEISYVSSMSVVSSCDVETIHHVTSFMSIYGSI